MTFKVICIEMQGYDRHSGPKKDDNKNKRNVIEIYSSHKEIFFNCLK